MKIKFFSVQRLLRKESIIESTGVMFMFSMIQKIIQIVRGIVFARFLGPVEYGVVTLAFIFIPFVVTISKLGLASCLERYMHYYEEQGKLKDFFYKVNSLTTVSSIIVIVFALLFSKQFSEIVYASSKYRHIIILCIFTTLPYVLYENFVSAFIGMRIFKMSTLITFSQFLIFSVLGILFVIYYPKAEALVLSNLISSVFVAVLFGFIIWKYILKSDLKRLKIQETDFYSKMFRYSVWIIITPLLSTLCSYIDRLMLNRFMGLTEVGVYSVASNFAGFLFMFGMIVGRVLLPSLSKIWEEGQKDRVFFLLNLSIKFSILILIFVAVPFILYKKQILSLLYGDKYLDGISVINILSIYWLFNVLFWIVKVYGELIQKTYLTFVASLIGLVSGIILNYFLIPYYKLAGAAVAATVTYILMVIIIFILNKMNGMVLERKTIVACLAPFILLFNNISLVAVSLILGVIILMTEQILTSNEKKYLIAAIRKNIPARRR